MEDAYRKHNYKKRKQNTLPNPKKYIKIHVAEKPQKLTKKEQTVKESVTRPK